MDIDGLQALLRGLESGEIKVVARDLPTPSPLAGGNPQRAAVRLPRRRAARRAPHERGGAAPLARSGNRGRHGQARSGGHCHGARGGLARGRHARRAARRAERARASSPNRRARAPAGTGYLEQLIDARRATRLHDGDAHVLGVRRMPAADPGRLSAGAARSADHARRPRSPRNDLDARSRPSPSSCAAGCRAWVPSRRAIWPSRSRLETSDIGVALVELESEGFVLRGRFTEEASAPEAVQQGDATLEWCERRLLARIHRYTIKTLRAEIEPVSGADFMRFLFEWQGVTRAAETGGRREPGRGHRAARGLRECRPPRGRATCSPRGSMNTIRTGSTACVCRAARCGRGSRRRNPPAPRRCAPRRSRWSRARTGRLWHSLAAAPREEVAALARRARAASTTSTTHGASFFDDLVSGTNLLRSQAETALGELVSAGLVNADSYQRPARVADSAATRGASSSRAAGASRCSGSKMPAAGA